MEPGHPHRTKQLDELRQKQRFELATITDDAFRGDGDWRGTSFLSSSPITIDVEAPLHDRQLSERYLREKAVDMRESEPDLAEFLAASKAAALPHATAVVLRGCDFGSNFASKVLDRAAEEFYALDPAVGERKRKVSEYITLLAMADAVADDGYHDPRIAPTKHGEAEAA